MQPNCLSINIAKRSLATEAFSAFTGEITFDFKGYGNARFLLYNTGANLRETANQLEPMFFFRISIT
jgi:hypothetical protein